MPDYVMLAGTTDGATAAKGRSLPTLRRQRAFMLPSMKRLAVSTRDWGYFSPSPGFEMNNRSGPFYCWLAHVPGGAISRGSVSLLFALTRTSPSSGARRRRRGFEGWGRHLRGGPATAAKATFALTHPSNLRETSARIVRAPLTRHLPAGTTAAAGAGQRGCRTRWGSKTLPSRSRA